MTASTAPIDARRTHYHVKASARPSARCLEARYIAQGAGNTADLSVRLTVVSGAGGFLRPATARAPISAFPAAADSRLEALMQRLTAEEQAANERRARKVARSLAAFAGRWTMQHEIASPHQTSASATVVMEALTSTGQLGCAASKQLTIASNPHERGATRPRQTPRAGTHETAVSSIASPR